MITQYLQRKFSLFFWVCSRSRLMVGKVTAVKIVCSTEVIFNHFEYIFCISFSKCTSTTLTPGCKVHFNGRSRECLHFSYKVPNNRDGNNPAKTTDTAHRSRLYRQWNRHAGKHNGETYPGDSKGVDSVTKLPRREWRMFYRFTPSKWDIRIGIPSKVLKQIVATPVKELNVVV